MALAQQQQRVAAGRSRGTVPLRALAPVQALRVRGMGRSQLKDRAVVVRATAEEQGARRSFAWCSTPLGSSAARRIV